MYLRGALEVDGGLDVASGAVLGSTLSVTGAATLSSTLAVTGAATLSSTLAVTGAATLSSTLAVTGVISGPGRGITLPHCVVYHNTTQSVSSGAWTALSANSERLDTDSMHSTVTNTSRITVPYAGKYRVSAVAGVPNNPAASNYGSSQAELRVNGASFSPSISAAIDTYNASGSAISNFQVLGISALLTLAANDYVEVFAYHSSLGNTNCRLHDFSLEFVSA
jgi:hypothetical protein